MNHFIYADNAATTPLDADAFEKMRAFFLDEYGNVSQRYTFSRVARNALRESREIIADCLNASPDEIFFTSGGTESDNWAIKGMMEQGDDRVVMTSIIEHHAILKTCASIERNGFSVHYLRPTLVGKIEPDTLQHEITPRTKLVSVMMANNEIGTIQPIQKLCAIAHAHGAVFHTDAVQAVGHIPIDVQTLGIDMLSASAHKFNGPKGIGFLFIRKGIVIQPLMDGGSQESGMRAGTENVPLIVGMATALKKRCHSIQADSERLNMLSTIFMEKLRVTGLDYIRNGEDHLPGLLSLSFRDKDGEALFHRLDLMGISVSTGSACDSRKTQISHVLQAIELPESYARGTIRISFGVSNTLSDVDAIISALVKILQ